MAFLLVYKMKSLLRLVNGKCFLRECAANALCFVSALLVCSYTKLDLCFLLVLCWECICNKWTLHFSFYFWQANPFHPENAIEIPHSCRSLAIKSFFIAFCPCIEYKASSSDSCVPYNNISQPSPCTHTSDSLGYCSLPFLSQTVPICAGFEGAKT